MTVEKAIEEVQFNMSRIGLGARAAKRVKEAKEMAIEALKKVQAFEAIGTIDEFKALKEKSESIVNGEWLDTQPDHCNGYYKNAHVCSNCHDYYTTDYEEMKFCPKCGAKMTED